MSLKLKEESGISFNLQDLIDDDYVITQELSLFASNIRKEVCDVLDGFFHSLKIMKKIKHITSCP